MNTWPVQDAKAKFSEMLEACMKEGPQLVTKRGAQAAVLVPVEQWARLNRAPRLTLKQLLMDDVARCDLPVRKRGDAKRRKPGVLG